MAENRNAQSEWINTPRARGSFMNLFEARINKEKSKDKPEPHWQYDVALLFGSHSWTVKQLQADPVLAALVRTYDSRPAGSDQKARALTAALDHLLAPINAAIEDVGNRQWGPHWRKIALGGTPVRLQELSWKVDPKTGELIVPVGQERGGYVINPWAPKFSAKKQLMTPPEVRDEKKAPITDPLRMYSGCYLRAAVRLFAYTAGKQGISAGLGNCQRWGIGEPLTGRRTADADFDEIDAEDVPDYSPDPDDIDPDGVGAF